jgi:hypothetical protein
MREIFGEVYIISTRNERSLMQPLAAELCNFQTRPGRRDLGKMSSFL